MNQAEQQLAKWVTADARALQRSAVRSALITGGIALGVLALALLNTVFAARSMARRRRPTKAPDLEGTKKPVPSTASAVSASFLTRNHPLLERLLRLIDS